MNESAKNDTAILVVSCDSYSDLWDPFFHCLFKYWPDNPFPVYLGSNYATYPDERVMSIPVGPDVDYSTNLFAMIEHIPQEWVILWIEDRVLCSPVNTNKLLSFIRQVQADDGGYLKLLSHHPYAPMQNYCNEIGELPKGIRYRVSITAALWKKSVLRQFLRPGESAWQIERQGGGRSNDVDARFFALTLLAAVNPPIQDIHLIIKGHMTQDGRKFLEKEGLHHCRAISRPLESFKTYVYVKLYVFSWNLHSLFSHSSTPLRYRLKRIWG